VCRKSFIPASSHGCSFEAIRGAATRHLVPAAVTS
jgi:hypothetical protein